MNPTTVSTLTDKQAELEALQKQTAELSASIEAERIATLKGLPASLGYDSSEAFIKAFKAANAGKSKGKKSATGRKPRVTLSPERREEIKNALKDGKTVADVVTEFDVSIATAQNLKKEAGLVKERSTTDSAS